MKVAIFGTGYVGLVTGVCLADLGHIVTCIDTNEEKIEFLNQGKVPIYEPGLEELIIKNRSRLYFTTDFKKPIQDAEVIFIAVGTPQGEDGSADLNYVKNVALSIASEIKEFKVIVVKSTVPVGTGDMIEEIISEKFTQSFAVVSNPEFLREGTAIHDFRYPDRIVVGTLNQQAVKVMEKLYEKLEAPFVVTDRYSSELIKYASNAFLATKISFINSIANLSEKVGADIDSIALGMGMDHRIGPHFLKAGIGYGGSCFPKDVQALIYSGKQQGVEVDLLESVERVNKSQKELVVKKLSEKIKLEGKKVAILGLSFKPDTDDLREAPSLVIIDQLQKKGVDIFAWDPIAEEVCRKIYPDIQYCPSPYEALTNAEAAIIVTEWNEVKELDLKKVKELMKTPLLFDGRNVFERDEVEKLGIEYMGVGR